MSTPLFSDIYREQQKISVKFQRFYLARRGSSKVTRRFIQSEVRMKIIDQSYLYKIFIHMGSVSVKSEWIFSLECAAATVDSPRIPWRNYRIWQPKSLQSKINEMSIIYKHLSNITCETNLTITKVHTNKLLIYSLKS